MELHLCDLTSNEIVETKSTSFDYIKGSTKLDEPTNLAFDVSTGAMTWDSVANAAGYYVEVLCDGGNYMGDNGLFFCGEASDMSRLAYEIFASSFEHFSFRVKAYGTDLTSYENSDWVEYIIK